MSIESLRAIGCVGQRFVERVGAILGLFMSILKAKKANVLIVEAVIPGLHVDLRRNPNMGSNETHGVRVVLPSRKELRLSVDGQRI